MQDGLYFHRASSDRDWIKLEAWICAGMPTTQRMAEYCLKLANKLILSYAATDLGMVSSMIITDASTYVPFDAGKTSL